MKRPRWGAEPRVKLQGDRVIVEYKGRTSKIPKYSDAVRLALLRARRPEEHSDRLERTGTDGRARSSGLAIVALSDVLVAALNKAEAQGKRVKDARASADTLLGSADADSSDFNLRETQRQMRESDTL